MSDNRNLEAAWNYHNATKHSFASIRSHSHSLDFANQPLPFKVYPTLKPLPLPSQVRQTGVAALSAIAEVVPALTDAAPDLEAVAQLLYLSAGITRHRKFGRIITSAAACVWPHSTRKFRSGRFAAPSLMIWPVAAHTRSGCQCGCAKLVRTG